MTAVPDQYALSKVRIKIRFEDYGDEPPLPVLPSSTEGPEAFGGGSSYGVDPSAFSVSQDIQAKSWTVELNSPRKADTAKVVFDLRALPLDTQVPRAATIQIFAGIASAEDFARANADRGSLGYLLPDAVPEGYVGAGMSWELFRGFIDEWEVDYEEGEIVVSARDTTGFFIDARAPENALAAVPKTARIDEAIRALIEGSPADGIEGIPGAKGTVVVVETSRTVPTLGEFLPPSWFNSKGRLAKGRKRKPKAAKEMSVWDQITDLCVAAGLKAYMRQPRKASTIAGLGAVLPAAEVVITDPQTYYKGDGNSLGRRVFTRGINVYGLKVARKLGGNPVPFVEIRSWDPVAGKQIVGRFPKIETGKKNKPTATGRGDRAEYEVFTIDTLSGPRAQEQADAIARSFYEQLGRGEFTVRFQTDWMSAIPENRTRETAADMLLMRPADEIDVYVEHARDEEIVLSDGLFAGSSKEEMVAQMVAGGMEANMAARAALAMRDPRVQRTFRVQTLIVEFQPASGYNFTVEAINYLDARYQP